MKLYHLIILLILLPVFLYSCKSTKETSQGVIHSKSKREAKKTAQDNSAVFINANKERILGNYEKAEKLFLVCLEVDPVDAASMYELARIYNHQRKIDLAIEYAKKEANTEPDNIYYQLLLSSLYKQNTQFEEAITVLKQIHEKYPYKYEYCHDLALTYLFTGNYKEAIKIYNKLEEKLGVTEDISIQKQKIYLLQKNIDKAIAELEKLTEAYPVETKYYAMLAELCLAHNKDQQALQAYQKILELEPENAYIHISLSDYYRKREDKQKSYKYLKQGFANSNLDIETKLNILLAFYTVNEYYDELKDQAFELSEILIEAHPNNPKAYSIYADILFQDKKYEESRDALHFVISLDSSRYLVWEQLLLTDSELKDYDAMAMESQRAIELFPQQPVPYMFSAIANYQLKNYEQSINDLEMGIKFVVNNDPLLVQFYSYLGDTYHQVKKNEASFDAYKNALIIDPDNSIVLNNYAYYLSLNNMELEKALEMARKATELDPENGSNQDTYGWVLYKLKRYEEAKEWISKALENHNEHNAVVLEHYGDVLYQLNRYEDAFEYWDKAIKAGEGSEFLEKKVSDKKLYE
jgi:tetratricopeptide (TPR) repeat protein